MAAEVRKKAEEETLATVLLSDVPWGLGHQTRASPVDGTGGKE